MCRHNWIESTQSATKFLIRCSRCTARFSMTFRGVHLAVDVEYVGSPPVLPIDVLEFVHELIADASTLRLRRSSPVPRRHRKKSLSRVP